jgi:hypothetical protein
MWKAAGRIDAEQTLFKTRNKRRDCQSLEHFTTQCDVLAQALAGK